jgi:hypothetical protein
MRPAGFAFVVGCLLSLLPWPARAQVVGEPPSPSGAVAARRACEIALDSERDGKGAKIDSRASCHRALMLGGQSEDMRNEAASMLAARRNVTLDDLAISTLLADAIIRKDPTEPWGYLARCDVARRIGSADVLETCLRDLRRIAPQHPATLKELARPALPVSPWLWATRALLALVIVGTLVHAARRRLARRGPARSGLAVAVVAIVLAVAASWAVAAPARAGGHVGPDGDLSRFKIDDANPESSVPGDEQRAKGPLQFGYFIQDLTVRAEAAAKKGDHAAAARYYAALAKAAPDVALPTRRLCVELQAAGNVGDAIKACRSALTRGGSVVGDFTRFVSLVLTQPDPLPAGEKDELAAVLKHLESNASVGAQLPMLRCEVALRFRDTTTLEACTNELGRVAPNDPKTISFQWAVALDHHDSDAAARFIDRAKGLGMAKEGVATMERATSDMHRRRVGRLVLLFAGVVALMFAVVRALRRLAARRRVTA